MSKLWCLLKVQLLGMFGFNKLVHGKKFKDKKLSAGIAAFAAAALVVAGVFVYYIYMFADIMNAMGTLDNYIPFMFTLCSLLIVFYGIFNVQGVLFGYRDYDLVMSLPVKPRVIVLAKILFVYLSDLVFSGLAMIAALIIYGTYVPLNAMHYVMLLLSLPFLPLIPLALAMIVGWFITVISARFKHKSAIRLVFTMILLAACFGVGFIGGSGEEGLAAMDLGKYYFMSAFFSNGLQNVLQFLIFAGISVAAAAVPCELTAYFFQQINSRMLSHKSNGRFVMKEQAAKTQFRTLLTQEFKRFFSISVYASNVLCGLVMTVFLTVGVCIAASQLKDLLSPEVMTYVVPFAPLAFVWALTLAPSTAVTVSIEGKTFWIVKTSPVDEKKVFAAKLTLYYALFLPVGFVCALVSGIFLGMNVWQIAYMVFVTVGSVLFGGACGFLSNLKIPVMHWDNPTVPVKQGFAVLLNMLINFLFVALLAGAALLSIFVNAILGMVAGAALVVLGTVLSFYILYGWGIKRYRNIES